MATELTVRVAKVALETSDIARFELVAADGSALPPFEAGAHIDVHLPGGLIRPYSLYGNPAEAHRYMIGVLRDPKSRGGSVAMHDQVSEGDTLTISTPRNNFPLADDAAHHVLLAGGIGITPMLSMAEALSGHASFELHYCTRSESRTAFRSLIAEADFAEHVRFHFDDVGPTLDLAELTSAPNAGTHLYVCGPTGFMDWVLDTAREAGWPQEQLHSEFFSADVGPSDDDADFEVELVSTGAVVPVAKDQTVIAALAAVGVTVPMSCEQGVCGTCLVKVLDGTPEHKDLYLMPKEQEANDQFLPCCSRSKTPRLVLDL